MTRDEVIPLVALGLIGAACVAAIPFVVRVSEDQARSEFSTVRPFSMKCEGEHISVHMGDYVIFPPPDDFAPIFPEIRWSKAACRYLPESSMRPHR